MKKLLFACIIFLCLWKEYCEYEPATNNNGDEQRPEIRIRPAINLDADSSAYKFQTARRTRKT